ncbi:hypothetical protein Pfo_028005 [Paulownia fortunei]|nr:hypothetical protein Pfo_028005 [Paulownia fortunei]
MSLGYTLKIIPFSSHNTWSCKCSSGKQYMHTISLWKERWSRLCFSSPPGYIKTAYWSENKELERLDTLFSPNFDDPTLKLIIEQNSFSGRPIVSAKCSLNVSTTNQNLVEKIRERITNGKVEISPSAYDTAWVAMVPSREYSGPCFPQCLDWITENQNPDGSWGLNPGHPYLVKDSLSCTLACVLALHKWNMSQQLVQRGLDFIASNGWAASHNDQFSPIGFNIIFPEMVNYAKELDLTLPLSPTLVDSLLHIQDSEIRKQNQEYVAEGLGNSCNWKGVLLAHQRSNGSLFNSPATTAAALIHCHDDKCFEYLISVLKACNRWGTSLPTVYPMDIYTGLYVVDTLERLGVNQHFEFELGNILDEIYR